jgi:hypothetical protein
MCHAPDVVNGIASLRSTDHRDRPDWPLFGVSPSFRNGSAMAVTSRVRRTVPPPQRRRPDAGCVADPREVDDALELAIDRTIAAQDEFETVPVADPRAVPKAEKVVHRAEDVKELADEAEAPYAE